MSSANDITPASGSIRDTSEECAASAVSLWQASLHGDRDAFQQLLNPHLEELLAAARRDLRYHFAIGDIRQDEISAEELVGETLLRAWRDRSRRPHSLDIRPWLLVSNSAF